MEEDEEMVERKEGEQNRVYELLRRGQRGRQQKLNNGCVGWGGCGKGMRRKEMYEG